MDSELIKFYKGERNRNNVTLEEVWGFSDHELENIHNYIQWIFPIVEPDYWDRDTPKLSEKDIQIFKNSKLFKTKVVKSLIVMSKFWGFDINYDNSGTLVMNKSESYNDKSKNWQTYMNHNFLRITRVIHCLNDLGFRNLAKVFYEGIIKVVGENRLKFNPNSVEFWKEAMKTNMKGERYDIIWENKNDYV